MTRFIKRNMTVLFAILIMGIASFAIVNAQPVYAAGDDIDSGVYNGVPWRITSEYELFIGDEGHDYTFDYIFGRPDYPWLSYCEKLKTAKFEGTVYGNGSVYRMFYYCRSLKTLDLSGFDTSNVTDMDGMFACCESLTTLDVSGFDTSNVTDMSHMFSSCASLTTLDVSDFDTSNVTDMSHMFGCSSLGSLNVSNFDTGNVTDMDGMFAGCESLTALDVSDFDTSNVTNMVDMFEDCRSLTSLDVSDFDTSNVTNMHGMFFLCRSLTALDVSGFDTRNVASMGMGYMFYDCRSLTALDVSGFDTSNVTNMDAMFYGCSSLTSLDLLNFDTSNVTSMGGMFNECDSLETLKIGKNYNTAASQYLGRFPVTMYNSETGVKYEAGDVIPSSDYVTYVDQFTGGLIITEDMLFEDYNKFLKNKSYNNMSRELSQSLEAGLSCRSGFADAISALKQNFCSGVIGTYSYLFKVNYTDWTERDMQKELASELVHSLATGACVDDYVGDAKDWTSKLEKVSKQLSEVDEDFTIKDMKEVANTFGETEKEKKQILALMKKLKAENMNNESFKKASGAFKEAGRILTVGDAVISAYMIYSADKDIVDKLLDLVDADSDLGKGLTLIQLEQERGLTISLLNSTLDAIAESEIPGLVQDFLCEHVATALTGGFAVSFEVAIGELLWKAIGLSLPGEEASEVNKAWLYIQNSIILGGECNNYRRKISKNWEEGGDTSTSELKSDYSLLMEAYYYSLVNSKDIVSKCAPKKEKKIIEQSFEKYIDHLSYQRYLKSCLQNANTHYRTTKQANGTVSISQMETKTEKSGTKKVRAASVDNLVYIDIPEEINGETVSGIEDGVLSNREDISVISLPDSLETIGNNSFQGCTALEKVFMNEGVKTIGSKAFGLCASLDTLDLPDSVEQVESDAFEGDEELVLMGASEYASDFAQANDMTFEAREKSIQKISVVSTPAKTSYRMDEPLVTTGLVVGLTYTDGTTGTIEEGFGCSFDGKRKIGTNTVIVMYKDYVAEFTVDITDDECSYNVSYVDEDGKELADNTTGNASGGATITLEAIDIDGYEPENSVQEVTIGVLNDFRFVYKRIPRIDIESASIECLEETDYTGQSIKPDVRVTIDDRDLQLNKDYLLQYGDNISGEGIIEIRGIGEYEGETYVVFTINKSEDVEPPHQHTWKHYKQDAGLLKSGIEYDYCTVCGTKANTKSLIGYAKYYVKSLKVAKGKKAFTVKWKKQSKANQKKFNGYQIRYSTKANMSGAKYTKAAKSSKSKKISKLRKKTKYYVQVRTYTVKGGKTFYSKWSAKKAISVK